MQIKPEMLDLQDWTTMKDTANQIIKDATRDLILWTNILKEVEAQILACPTKTTSKEEEKNTKSVKS